MTEPMEMESEVAIPQNPEEIKPRDDGEDGTSLNAVSSDSDAESDSETDDEAQDALQRETLEAELSRNPSNYDAHVQYIRLLRKAGEIDKLRQARESMSQLFPLTPSMWQEWAKDETTLSSGNLGLRDVKDIFTRLKRNSWAYSKFTKRRRHKCPHDTTDALGSCARANVRAEQKNGVLGPKVRHGLDLAGLDPDPVQPGPGPVPKSKIWWQPVPGLGPGSLETGPGTWLPDSIT
ncbi:hypothetical protein Cgig2_027873 [Carnegiea gigantea]|uniref:Squamous cell carcinoma antigen recognized by T-cells 3 n=1 Tax=Carnegiea gigantea TaxID=171969 RepID=A0A9Q1KM46_9CARY|nr:hypothetical protein Cgig2_027873 [Carnegiea gigantea]